MVQKIKIKIGSMERENTQFIKYMCKKCRFYEGKCIKGRVVKECAKKRT